MWPFRDPKNALPTFAVENTIGAGSRVRGDLSGPGGFRVDGTVEGAIDATGPVVIGEEGLVEGSLRGRDIVVLGRVRGDVTAAGHLEIGPKGKILGDITMKSLRLHTGGLFRGTSGMPGGEDAFPAQLTEGAKEDRRGRTLPPPNGAVPPPPTLAELAEITPLLVPHQAVSHERLLTSAVDGRAAPGETGT